MVPLFQVEQARALLSSRGIGRGNQAEEDNGKEIQLVDKVGCWAHRDSREQGNG